MSRLRVAPHSAKAQGTRAGSSAGLRGVSAVSAQFGRRLMTTYRRICVVTVQLDDDVRLTQVTRVSSHGSSVAAEGSQGGGSTFGWELRQATTSAGRVTGSQRAVSASSCHGVRSERRDAEPRPAVS